MRGLLRDFGRRETRRFELGFRRPYDWAAVRAFLGSRALPGVEAVDGALYRRTARITLEGRDYLGWIEVSLAPKKPALRVTVAASLADASAPVLSRVGALMDLACRPAEIARTLGPLARRRPGMRVPGAFDSFELAVRAILGQQVTLAAARTVAGRLAAALGDTIETPFTSLTTAFPPAQRVADANLARIARLGMPGARARSVLALARAVADGKLALVPSADIDATLERLRALPGVGEWTAQYIAMRALAWPDAFPHSDYGVMKALGVTEPRRALAAGEAWRPWRAYVVMHLWESLRKVR